MEDRYEAEIRLGRGAEFVTDLTELVAGHPVRERLVAALMRALGAAGRCAEALIVYQRAREALADTLGVDPSPELSALHVALLRGELGVRDESRTTNLRAADNHLRRQVCRHRRGAQTRSGASAHHVERSWWLGKTRLATETARTLLGDLPDGAWLVDLAAIDVSGDMAQSTLAALGLRDALLGGAPNAEPMDRLIAAIREREMLLILDNCEHVIESAAAFAHRLLGECQRLRIPATSREPLSVTCEALWQVEPLVQPVEDADPGRVWAVRSSRSIAMLDTRIRMSPVLRRWK
jgi:Bacterial transcriptional activator domain